MLHNQVSPRLLGYSLVNDKNEGAMMNRLQSSFILVICLLLCSIPSVARSEIDLTLSHSDFIFGSGTADCVAKFTGAEDIGCSQATDDGTDFTVGTAFTITASATSGTNNVFIGQNAGLANASGASNTFVGVDAGLNNTSSNNNTFVGRNAGLNNTTGFNNVSIGRNAGLSNTTGADNTFVGVDAGRFLADGATAHQTGSTSVFIGRATKANADGETNQIVIGFDATGHGSNTMTLGNTSLTQVISDMGTGFAQYTLDGANGGCLMLRDTDDAGWSQIEVLDGTITASADDGDGVCD